MTTVNNANTVNTRIPVRLPATRSLSVNLSTPSSTNYSRRIPQPVVSRPRPAIPVRPTLQTRNTGASGSRSRPTVLGADHIKRAIGDPNFFTSMPEFLTIKRKIDAMHLNLGQGCSSCQQRRAVGSMTSDFVTILNSLSDDGLQRLKRYFGINKMIVRAINPRTRKAETREV